MKLMNKTPDKKMKATGLNTWNHKKNVNKPDESVNAISPTDPKRRLIVLERIGKKAKMFTDMERKPNTWVTDSRREAKAIEARIAQLSEKGEE